MKRITLIAVVTVALASATAYAQMHHGQSQAQPGGGMMHDQMQKKMHGKMHGGQTGAHAGHGASAGPQGPSSLAFHGINQKMHEGMNITFTGNADVDFVRLD